MTGVKELRLSPPWKFGRHTDWHPGLIQRVSIDTRHGSKPDAKREGDRKRESTTVRLEIPSHLEPRDRDLLRPK